MRDKINIKRGNSENVDNDILSVEKEISITENCTLGDVVESNNSNAADEKRLKEKPDKIKKRQKVLFFLKGEKENGKEKELADEVANKTGESIEKTGDRTEEDLGGVLLSSNQPTITRQLNVLSNIVKRALLFGGDQELLVLSETLEADKNAFIQKWYPGTSLNVSVENESRPGVQYFNNLVQLLRNCYNDSIVSDLNPPLPLTSSYANSYERLVASLVELGSGYINPWSLNKILQVCFTNKYRRFICY